MQSGTEILAVYVHTQALTWHQWHSYYNPESARMNCVISVVAIAKFRPHHQIQSNKLENWRQTAQNFFNLSFYVSALLFLFRITQKYIYITYIHIYSYIINTNIFTHSLSKTH